MLVVLLLPIQAATSAALMDAEHLAGPTTSHETAGAVEHCGDQERESDTSGCPCCPDGATAMSGCMNVCPAATTFLVADIVALPPLLHSATPLFAALAHASISYLPLSPPPKA